MFSFVVDYHPMKRYFKAAATARMLAVTTAARIEKPIRAAFAIRPFIGATVIASSQPLPLQPFPPPPPLLNTRRTLWIPLLHC